MPRPPFRTNLGPHPNEGARRLRAAMARKRLNLRTAAKLLGVNSGVISRWVFCDGRPGIELAERMRQKFGIPIVAWFQPPAEPIMMPDAKATGTEG